MFGWGEKKALRAEVDRLTKSARFEALTAGELLMQLREQKRLFRRIDNILTRYPCRTRDCDKQGGCLTCALKEMLK